MEGGKKIKNKKNKKEGRKENFEKRKQNKGQKKIMDMRTRRAETVETTPAEGQNHEHVVKSAAPTLQRDFQTA